MRIADLVQAHALDTPVVNKKVKIHDFHVTIEHPKGTIRQLHDDNGNVVYKQHMHHSYGYFNQTKGRDGDEVDCFVGPVKHSSEVYIVHMLDKGPVPAEREDEDKCFIGFPSADAAKAAFLLHYPQEFYGGMTSLPIATFKKKMKQASAKFHKRKIHAKRDLRGHTDALAPTGRAGQLNRHRTARMLPGAIPEVDTLKRVKKSLSLSKAGCPKCGSKKIVLMPTDFETAKCKSCNHTWQESNPPKP